MNNILDKHTVGCVIMASGLGKRFGSDKLMADFCGSPMVQRIIDHASQVFEKVVVVTRSLPVKALCEAKKVPVIFHELPGRNDTVRLGTACLKDEVDACIYCPADQPLLSVNTLIRLKELSAQNPQSIVRPVFFDQPAAPVVFPARFFDELMALPEKKGGGYVAGLHPDDVIYLQGVPATELMDADTEKQLEELKKQSE